MERYGNAEKSQHSALNEEKNSQFMSSIPRNLKTILTIGIPCLVIAILLIFFGDTKNPKEISLDRMENLKKEITSFSESNGRAPVDLAELRLPAEQTQDHLGEPFKYSVSDGTITLLSYGSDKEPGGSFFKKDFSMTFALPK